MTEIKLPPLTGTLADLPERHKEVIEAYGKACATAAIEADRQARGEPVEASEAYDTIDSFLRNNLDDDDYALYSSALDDVYTAQQPPQLPAGYKLVPIEPTEEMLFACQDAGSISNHQRGKRIYKAMLEAAPEVKP